MIKSKKLSKFQEIKHGFFNKEGGKSEGIYKSLNCGIGSSDTKKNVRNNLKIVCKKINCSSRKLILLNQIHSNKFYFIDKNFEFNKKKLKGDALITNVKNIAIGVLTADCVPILIYDKKYCSLRKSVIKDFEMLKKVKIVHNSPKEAAKFVNENYNNLEKWWHSKLLQKVKNEFCYKFARQSESPLKDLKKILSYGK